MKLISKIIAAATAILTIALFPASIVSAAEAVPCSQVKVICNGAECSNIKDALDKLCKKQGCNINEILKKIGGFCPSGGCVDFKPSVPAQQPASAPSPAPEEKPDQPVVTPPKPTVPPQTDASEFNTAFEAEVLKLVNSERGKYGLAPLVQDSGATEVAHLRSKEIVKSFSHTRPNGSTCFTAANELGVSYRSAGENIAYGYPSPKSVVSGWMNSDGHRKNILSGSFSKIGIGCYESDGILYWTQFFIG